ncbi:uncharacterized protein WM277_023345 [Molossus nigricans]
MPKQQGQLGLSKHFLPSLSPNSRVRGTTLRGGEPRKGKGGGGETRGSKEGRRVESWRLFPGKNCSETDITCRDSSAPLTLCTTYRPSQQNCWRRPARWKLREEEREPSRAAEQGGRHKGGGLAAAASARAGRRGPAALLDRSPVPAARNKVYVLLRPHPPPPTQDRASPRPASPNSTRDPEHHPSLAASTTKRHTDRPARVNSRGGASRAGRASASR